MTWYLEGVSFDTGETATGSFKYNPFSSQNGNFADVDIYATQDGNTIHYVTTNPALSGDEDDLNFVTLTTGDLTATPRLKMELAQA